MVIRAIADLHGRLPWIEDCDLLLVGGDIAPDHYIGKEKRYALDDVGASWQLEWLRTQFMAWLTVLDSRCIKVVGIAGNHDFVFERLKHEIPGLQLPWTYLLDEEVTIDGVRIYGTPWVPGLPRWAFYGSEQALQARADAIPSGIDILLSHGPPFGVTDFTAIRYGRMHVGDPALNGAIDRVRPAAVVCGHIHEGFGYQGYKGVPIYNVSHMDEMYADANQRGSTLIQI